MNTINLLKESAAGRGYAEHLEENIAFGCKYDFVDKLDEVLDYVSDDQMEIILEKIKPITNLDQLLDKLFEFLVAHKYLDKAPIFNDDSESEPDIFLKKTEKYIEVKRVNNSDEQKEVIDLLAQKGGLYLNGGKINSKNQAVAERFVYKKACEHIDKAASQLEGRCGVIFLIYSLDLLGYIKSLNQREVDFVKKVKEYFEEKYASSNLTLRVGHQNKIFGNVHYKS